MAAVEEGDVGGRYSRRERKKRGLGKECFEELRQLKEKGGRRSEQFKVPTNLQFYRLHTIWLRARARVCLSVYVALSPS